MIQRFADWLVYEVFSLDASTPLGIAVNFFFYDTIKIVLLLFLISMLMGIINAYFPIERLKRFLVSHKLYGLDYLLAALFGGITPFCSCSSVPLFIGFVRGGIPLGVTLTFLIASPLVSEIAIAMFLGIFGFRTTLIYIISGTLLSMIAGWLLSKMHLERYLSDWVKAAQQQSNTQSQQWEAEHTPFFKRLPVIAKDALGVVKGVILYILLGIGVGAAMHGYVPEGFFEQFLAADAWWSVPLAVVLAVPMYANPASIVPIIEVFVAKGIPLGTAIAFMMAVIGLSIPEATMLKKVMTWRLIGIFFGVVTVLIIISGYLFNWIV